MATQTAMNGAPAHGTPIESSAAQVGENVANLASELVTLTELQAKLAILDLQESGAQAVTPGATFVGGACLALGSIPVLLLTLTWTLDRLTSLTLEGSAAVVSLSALALGTVCMIVGYLKVRQAFRYLNRSREEFQANLRWIKQAIQHSSSSSRRF